MSEPKSAPILVLTVPGPRVFTDSSADVIRILEQALADAQAGKITAIAVVTVTDRGGVSSCFAGEDQVFTLLGGLEWAKQRMGKEAIGV